MSVSVVLEGLDGLGQVAVELHHAGWEERVDHGARQEAPQVRLEETEQLGFVWLPRDGDTDAATGVVEAPHIP